MDNKQKILDVAMELFAARGYDAVGIQEIVEIAGVTKPVLYHYFNSKHGLLEAALAFNFEGFMKDLAQAADYHGDLTLALQNVAKLFFGFASQNPTAFRTRLALYFAPPQSEAHRAVLRYNEEQSRIIEEMFRVAVKDHGNMRGRQRAYAATFLGMIHTYVGLFLNGYTSLEDPLVYRAVHQFMHGILS